MKKYRDPEGSEYHLIEHQDGTSSLNIINLHDQVVAELSMETSTIKTMLDNGDLVEIHQNETPAAPCTPQGGLEKNHWGTFSKSYNFERNLNEGSMNCRSGKILSDPTYFSSTISLNCCIVSINFFNFFFN